MKSRIAKSILMVVFFVFLLYYKNCCAVEFVAGDLALNKKVKSLREIRDENVVKQTTDYSCGAAGLATILNYHLHEQISEKEIIGGMLKTTDLKKVQQRKGFSLLDIKKFVQSKGYAVAGYQMDLDFLRQLGKPVLVPIKFKDYRHFVVVKGVIADRVFVADPAMGNMSLKINSFMNIWQDGIGLVVEDKSRKVESSQLLVKADDLDIVDLRGVKRLFEDGIIRTAVFPTEF